MIHENETISDEARSLWPAICDDNWEKVAQIIDAKSDYQDIKSAKSQEDRAYAINFFCFTGVNYIVRLLKDMDIEALDQDIASSISVRKPLKYFLKSIEFDQTYKGLIGTVKRFFSEDLSKSDIPDRLEQWAHISRDQKKFLILDVINQIFQAASDTSHDFDGLEGVLVVPPHTAPEGRVSIYMLDEFAETNDTEDVLVDVTGQALGDTRIDILNTVLDNDTPEDALKTAAHEAMHILDARLRKRNAAEYQANSLIFDTIRVFQLRYKPIYERFIYKDSPMEKFEAEEDFYSIIKNAMEEARKPKRGWVAVMGF